MGIVCREERDRKFKNKSIEISLNNINDDNYSFDGKKKSITNKINNNYKKNNENRSINKEILDELEEKALTKHNEFRQKHQSKDLILSQKLSEMAKKFATKCAENNTINIDHCPDLYNDDIIGQNIAVIKKSLFDIEKVCQTWYSEGNNYDYNQNKYMSNTGHFTQIIWKETKKVGFGYSESKDGNIYFVANYYPAGNIFNEFKKNVEKNNSFIDK